MTRELSAELPDVLCRLLDGSDLEGREGETFILLTVSEDGWPHVALLSVGEVLALSPRELRLALWPKSETTANLQRTGLATLATFLDGTAYYVELVISPLPRDGPMPGSQAAFSAHVRRALADTVGYADLTSGVRFRLKSRDEVLQHWHRTIQALRA